ncbi:unnamed protein product [Parascedosporium putredinis]|uniref:Uncharacterized protein n=1 Tax=Parascedosporium putredinis TaxID=1442378 RepID=A0A9P1MDT8_9PEZI|nr:unnamed protein product [Parascedosporium putredinis]CAI7999254.1 unnamed protein product [Parascedosporium putredinis]
MGVRSVPTFGEDPDSVDSTHEFLIRGVEWLLTVENAWPDALSYGKNMHLNSARALAQRVGFVDILQNQLKDMDSNDVSLEDIADAAFWANQLSMLPAFSGSPGSQYLS